MKARSVFILGVLIAALGSMSCTSQECRQMTRCCEVVAEVEGVGHTCGAMAQGVEDPATCRSIVTTLRFMLEDKGKPIPVECADAG